MKKIIIEKKLCAIIFNHSDFKIKKNGIKFLTDSKLNFQIGSMKHKKNHEIQPHYHPNQKRVLNKTSEVLIINSGELKINFFTKNFVKIKSVLLKKGYVALLLDGVHGFKVIKDCDFIEIKQGPFLTKKDKSLIKKH